MIDTTFKPTREEMGGVLKRARQKLNLTQEEMAERIGMQKTHYNTKENTGQGLSLEKLGAMLEKAGFTVEVTARVVASPTDGGNNIDTSQLE